MWRRSTPALASWWLLNHDSFKFETSHVEVIIGYSLKEVLAYARLMLYYEKVIGNDQKVCHGQGLPWIVQSLLKLALPEFGL